MKILSIGNFTTGWDGSICDEEHIAKALEELGHEVTRWERRSNSQVKYPKWKNFDFALVAQWDGYSSDLISWIKIQCNCPVVYWAFDYQAEGQEWHEQLVKEADLYLSKRIADSKYPNWQWLSQDFSPKFLDVHPDWHETNTDTIDVLFTGSYLPWADERTATLQAIDEKFNLHIYSVTPNEWIKAGLKNVHGPIMDELLPELYSKAKIHISIDHTIERGYWSDRNAQIMACRGFVLFRYVPLSEATFKDGVKYFYNVDDCLEKIRYYLDHPEERAVTRARGYEIAHTNLMVKNRVQDLLTIVGSIL